MKLIVLWLSGFHTCLALVHFFEGNIAWGLFNALVAIGYLIALRPPLKAKSDD